MFLAGDIGGTKTHLALFEKDSEKPIKDKKFPSKDFKSLCEIVSSFLESGEKIEKACFGIAGPVKDGKCKATNLPWVVETANLSKVLNTSSIALLNDLESNAWGIRTLPEEDFFTLNEGSKEAKSNQALISAGTGLGEAGLLFDGKDHLPFACEGGHCDFAPRNEEEIELWMFLNKKFGHVSYERVLSGPGFVNIYEFIVESKKEKPSSSIDEKEGSVAKIITERALSKSCPACEKTLEWFVSLYGAEAGNLALKYLSLGGLYIGGGIAPKILEEMKDKIFMDSFTNKGRFASLLSSISVKVVLNPLTALFGSAYFARNRI